MMKTTPTLDADLNGKGPKMKCSFIEFIRTGKLGKLQPGSTEAELITNLGRPDDTEPRRRRGRTTWKYASFQFGLEDGVIGLIGLYWFPSPFTVPGELEIVDHVPHQRLSEAQFKEHLQKNGIESRIDVSLTFDDQRTLRTAEGVSIVFDQKLGLEKILSWVGVDNNG